MDEPAEAGFDETAFRRYPNVTQTKNKNGLHRCKPLIYLVAGARKRTHLRHVRIV
jgi:hypothetical protein